MPIAYGVIAYTGRFSRGRRVVRARNVRARRGIGCPWALHQEFRARFVEPMGSNVALGKTRSSPHGPLMPAQFFCSTNEAPAKLPNQNG